MSAEVFNNHRLVSSFCSFLTVKEVTEFESASKNFVNLTNAVWRHFQVQYQCQMTFSCCEIEKNKDKWNYIVARSVRSFVLFNDSNHFLMKKYSLYKYFVTGQLKAESLDTRREGDFLLQALQLKCFYKLEEAIETRGVPMAASLALFILKQEHVSWCSLEDARIALALKAAKQKKFSTIENLTSDWAPPKLKELLESTPVLLPTVRYQYALKLKETERELILDKVIQEYQILKLRIPSSVLKDISLVKCHVKKYEEAELYAEQLLQRGITSDESFSNLLHLGEIKQRLKKFKESVALYEQAYREQNFRHSLFLANLAVSKYSLEHYVEAEKLFDIAFSDKEFQPKWQYLNYVIELKCRLRKYIDAEKYCSRALNTVKKLYPPLLFSIGETKRLLGKVEQANKFFDEALKKIDKLIYDEIRVIAEFKEKLGQKELAKCLYEKAIKKCGDLVDYKLFSLAAINLLALKKFEEAELLFDTLLSKIYDQIKPEVFLEIALAKLYVKKPKIALELIDKAFSMFESENFCKLHLEKCGETIDKIIPQLKALSITIPDVLIQAAANPKYYRSSLNMIHSISEMDESIFDELNTNIKIKVRLAEFEEAEKFFEQLFFKFEDEMTSDDFIQGAIIKIMLKKYSDSEKLIELALFKFERESSYLVLEKKKMLIDRIKAAYESQGTPVPKEILAIDEKLTKKLLKLMS